MSEVWVEKKIVEIAEFKYGKSLSEPNRVPGPYPVIGSGGISGYHNKAIVKSGIVVGRKGSIGTVQWFDSAFFPIDTVYFIDEINSENNLKYFYYFLQSFGLENYNSDAAVPGLSRSLAYGLRAKFPSLRTQEKIAEILSTYDQLIENNIKRIAILEQMAEQIYKEWFVRMRFPGYENTKLVKGIPEGWMVETLGKTVNVLMGQSPKSEFYNEDGVGLPFHQGVGSYGDVFPNHDTYCSVKGRLANEGDILFSVRAPVGRLNIADRKLIIGRGLSAMKHKKGYNSFLFHFLKHQFSREDIIGNGAIFNSVGKDELNGFKYFEPSDSLIQDFEKIVKPIDAEVKNLYQQIDQLRTTRDLLLPRLISGKLSVENLTSKLQETA